MNTKQVIAKAEAFYDDLADEKFPRGFNPFEVFSTKELWFLWGLCCTPDGRAFDDEVYDELDRRGEFKHEQ